MKKKILLCLALLASVVVNAQVLFEENFTAEQTKESTEVGWYEFINSQEGDSRDLTTLDGQSCVQFFNSTAASGQAWQRAIKFRNLPIKENTAYRVTLKVQGSNEFTDSEGNQVKTRIRADLMQGEENNDVCFLNEDGTDQHQDISHLQEPEEGKGWFTYSKLFFYSTKEIHQAKKPGMPEIYFLTINCYDPGNFYITGVKVEEATMDGVAFRDDVIRIDLGFPIDLKSLIPEGRDRYMVPNDAVKVKLDGKEVNILSVEIRKDGKFYVFLDDEYPDSEDAVVEVSFTNPGNIKYDASSPVQGLVKDFDFFKASYDENMDDVYSYEFETPTLIGGNIENGSFNLPLDMKEFILTFDKGVDITQVKATLDNEVLKVSGEGDFPSTITLTRGDGDIVAGQYTLTVDKIYPQYTLGEEAFGTETFELSFGKPQADPTDVVKVVMTDEFDAILNAGNFDDTKWTVYNEGTPQTGNGSGCRILGGFSGDAANGAVLYIGTRGAYGWATYGEREEAEKKFTLTPGKYVFSANYGGWDGNNVGAMRVQILDADGSVIAEDFQTKEFNIKSGQKIEGSPKFEMQFRIAKEGNYVINVLPRTADDKETPGWSAIAVTNVQVKYLPNQAGVEETAALASALEAAKACQENNASERYAGPAKDNLDATILKIEAASASYTKPSEYAGAVAALDAAVKEMVAHSTLCNTYDPLFDQAVTARDNRLGSKFENSDIVLFATATIEKYGEEAFDPETLETRLVGKKLTDDAELTQAIADLNKAITGCKTIGRTTQNDLLAIQHGIATLDKLGASDEKLTAAFASALEATPALTADVQLAVKKAMYAALVADPNFFDTKLDPTTLVEESDSVDMTAYIANPEMCTTTFDDKYPDYDKVKQDPSSENFPGWTIENVERGWDFAMHYPWGGDASYHYEPGVTANSNVMIASWGTGFDLVQTIENLPVGVYSLHVAASERTDDHTIASYAFAETTETVLDPETLEEGPMVYKSMLPMLGGGTEPQCWGTINYGDGSFSSSSSAITITGIVVKDGKLKIGVHGDSVDHPFVNAFSLVMTNKLEGYDYSQPIVTKGDVNNDSKVDVQDYLMVLNHYLEASVIDINTCPQADVNGDGKIDMQDGLAILNIYLSK